MATAEPTAHLDVRLQPRASRDEIAGERDGRLLVRVTAPPVDGRANAALCKLVARTIGIAPSRVTVIRGAAARDKRLAIHGLDDAALHAALGSR
jgi:uncharacterized protein (TIGR00251 family)